MEDYLTIPDVARQLHYHPDTIRAKVNDGGIPHVKVGRHYRIPRSWLDAQLHKEVPPKAPATASEVPSKSAAVASTESLKRVEPPTEAPRPAPATSVAVLERPAQAQEGPENKEGGTTMTEVKVKKAPFTPNANKRDPPPKKDDDDQARKPGQGNDKKDDDDDNGWWFET